MGAGGDGRGTSTFMYRYLQVTERLEACEGRVLQSRDVVVVEQPEGRKEWMGSRQIIL